MLCALLLVSTGWARLLAQPGDQPKVQPGGDRPVLLIEIKGAIGVVAAEQLTKALQRAAAAGAPALLVRMDTPGGLLSSTREMIQGILASPVPVVMYVAPNGSRAASAGTYLMYASHVAAMAPSTHLGAATPISLTPGALPGFPPPQSPPQQGPDSSKDGKDKQPADGRTDAERKAVNDAVAYIRSLAELRGRNADWAEKAVREAATLTASAALKEGVIDLIVNDVNDLLTQIDGRMVATPAGKMRLETKGRAVVEIKPDWKAQFMSAISDPNVALILLMIGIYGLFFEFWSPGAVAPGVIGGISLIVALAALSVLPVNYAGLALLALGVALMVAEAFLPSFGVVGLGGIAAFILGAVFLFDPSQSDVPIKASWPVVASLAAVSAAFFLGVVGFAMRARSRPVLTGAEELLGSVAEVVYWSGGAGRVRVRGEIWSAEGGAILAAGQKVRVIGRSGLTLAVEPKT
ncbi:MAG: nodulation protein NfeD [Hyphomicrobiaceae bacterium]|nr:nodulation protein NfeD [Hyphomicrobiaceae bacterium]